MVELRKAKKGDLKASTIVEVLVAISIVSICFTAFFICFQMVSTSNKSTKMMKAMEVVEALKQKAEQEGDWSDDEVEIGALTVVKTVKDEGNGQLKHLSFQIMQDSVTIDQLNYFTVSEK